MAVASVANHGERHVNPLTEQYLERQSGTSAVAKETVANNAVAEDTFTPSNQSEPTQSTAEAPGIVQLEQASTAANAAPAQAPSQTTPNADSRPDAGTPTADTVTTAQSTVTSAPTGTPAGTVNTSEQGQEQALNTELAALGLSNYDILQIDRIATVIQNFNPSAYTDLVNQFERQVQEASQLSTPPPAANSGSEANTPAAENSSAAAAANANGAGQQGSGANNTLLGSANLQIEPAQFTLANNQAVQSQTPQQNSSGATGHQKTQQLQNDAV